MRVAELLFPETEHQHSLTCVRRVPEGALLGEGPVGPVVWCCKECLGSVNAQGRAHDGSHDEPRLCKWMLANSNWLGAWPEEFRKLRFIEAIMLLPMRIVRSRAYCQYGSTIRELRMPVSLGTAMFVPCATAGEDAVRWPAEGIKVPLSPERAAASLADKVRIVLAGPIDLEKMAKDWDRPRLLHWLEEELEGCPELCVRRDVLRKAAEWMSQNTLFKGSHEIIDWTELENVKDGVPAAFLLR